MKKKKKQADLTQPGGGDAGAAVEMHVVEAQADLSQSFSSLSVSVSLFSLMRRAKFFFLEELRRANEMLLEGSGGEK